MTPATLGDYSITRLLGRGGMAEVYEGYDPDLDRPVAIKVILPAVGDQPGFEERFRREARLVASLRHPHIVQVYDFAVVEGKPFMVMEYLEGGSLKDRLADLRSRGETMALADIARILDALAGALEYAHGRGAVHRDIKPANILFTRSDEPVVADFGIARLLGGEMSQLTTPGQIVGSPAYMAPEQARGEVVDARCDQYALGVVLYEMATGRTPFHGDSPTALLMAHVSSPPPPPRSFNPNLPEAIQAVLLKALAKQPAQRFAAMGDLAHAFRQALAGEMPVEAIQPSPSAPTLAESPAVEPGEAVAPALPSSEQKPVGQVASADRLLDALVKVAGIFAPLAGKEAPNAGEASRERRSRLAVAMGAAGVLLASLKVVAGAFDLVSRPAALLGQILPYLAIVLLVGCVALSVRIALRSPTLRRRRQAAGFLLVILLVGLVWGGYTAYAWLRPPEGFKVLIADFDGSNATRRGDFAGRIGAELTSELRDAGSAITVERSLETYADSDAAQAAGRKRKAAMVIWGAYDDFGVTPRVELLRQPTLQGEGTLPQLVLNAVEPAPAEAADLTGPFHAADVSYLTRTPLASTDLDLFAAHGPEQMVYVVSAILGTGLYVDGHYEDALALFDKSLANAEAGGGDMGGQARVVFQRAMATYALGRADEAASDLERAIAIDPNLFEAHYNLAIYYSSTCTVPDPLERAIAQAETAARLQPDNAQAHRLLSSLYQQAGRHEEALVSLQSALSHDTQDPFSYQLLASVYSSLGRESESKQASQQAVSLHQSDLASGSADPYDTQLALGDGFVTAGQYDQAIAAYQAAQGLRPNAAAPHRGLGNAFYWQGQLDQAIAEYRQAATLAPNDPSAPLLAGLVQAQKGDLDGAIASQEAAARLSSCDPSADLLLGGLHFQQNDFAQAAAHYEAALARDPTNADVWYVLGSLRDLQGDLAGAAEAAQKAVSLDPDMVQAQRLLALSHYRLGDAAAALPAAQTLTRLDPATANNQTLLGDIYLSTAEWESAVQAYEAALALSDDPKTRIVLGMAQVQLGQIDAAIEQYRTALAAVPENGLAWQSLGDALAQQGHLAQAIDAYEQSLRVAENALAHGQVAALYLQQGDVEEAIAHYKQAVALEPTNAATQVRLGGLYASQGKLTEAETVFRSALTIAPDNAEAHAGLAGAAYRQCSINTAVQSMGQAATLAPTYRGALAALYEAQGRIDDAEALYLELDQAPEQDTLARLAVADYLFRSGKFDEAARSYQQLLETGSAPSGLITSLIHNALGQIDVVQERLFAAGGEFEQALAAFPANAEAQAGLGDLALREGDPAKALAAYDAARLLIPQYMGGLPAENGSLMAVGLQIRRSLALAQQGDGAASAAALDQALDLATTATALTPRAPLAQFALGTAHLARGEAEDAEAAFARASECDQSLIATRSRLEAILERLRPAE